MTMPREKEKQQPDEEKVLVHNYLKSKSEVSTAVPSVKLAQIIANEV